MRDVQCKRCIEYKGNWCDKKRDDPDPDMVRDCHWFRTMTNADRIRAMNDEQLAEMFTDTYDDENIFYCPVRYQHRCLSMDCKVCFLDWLKQEVKG